MRSIMATLIAALLLSGSPAEAQQQKRTPGGFVTVRAGSQTVATVSTSSEFELLGRRGTVNTVRRETTALLVEAAAGHRVFGHLALGVAALTARTTQPMTYDAMVPISVPPNPVIPPGALFPVSGVEGSAEHRETQLHFSALWVIPFNDKVSVDFNGGPSAFFVKQDTIASMTDRAFPVVTKDKQTAMGYHVGFNLRALLFKNAGLAFGIRHARATADFTTGPQKVGGLQVDAGLALVF